MNSSTDIIIVPTKNPEEVYGHLVPTPQSYRGFWKRIDRGRYECLLCERILKNCDKKNKHFRVKHKFVIPHMKMYVPRGGPRSRVFPGATMQQETPQEEEEEEQIVFEESANGDDNGDEEEDPSDIDEEAQPSNDRVVIMENSDDSNESSEQIVLAKKVLNELTEKMWKKTVGFSSNESISSAETIQRDEDEGKIHEKPKKVMVMIPAKINIPKPKEPTPELTTRSSSSSPAEEKEITIRSPLADIRVAYAKQANEMMKLVEIRELLYEKVEQEDISLRERIFNNYQRTKVLCDLEKKLHVEVQEAAKNKGEKRRREFEAVEQDEKRLIQWEERIKADQVMIKKIKNGGSV